MQIQRTLKAWCGKRSRHAIPENGDAFEPVRDGLRLRAFALVSLMPMLGHGFHPVLDLHLLADVFHVSADGFGGDVEFIADFLVDIAGHEHVQYLMFPGRQLFLSLRAGPKISSRKPLSSSTIATRFLIFKINNF